MRSRLEVLMLPSVMEQGNIAYDNVKEWDFSLSHGLMIELEDGALIYLNPMHVIGVVYKELQKEG
jgi:hypothetical protein